MRLAPIRRLIVALAGALLGALASAAEPCRVAFDIGSSGIRAGASNSALTTRVDIDYLAPLAAGRGLEATLPTTIAALRDLPQQGGFSAECVRVGAGFSAWRLALQQDAEKLATQLAEIEAASGVAVLVAPQQAEGAYGHFAAQQQLGERLRTSHVLDIGGGSLQLAGERHSFGAPLGQKIWHRELCQAIRQTTSPTCALQPISGDELAAARALLAERLHGVSAALPESVAMTAISRPVTQGVWPAVERLLGKAEDNKLLERTALTAAIEQIADLTLAQTTTRLGISEKYAAYLLSDMLLVEGLMRATGDQDLHIADVDLTNIPGLLADDRAFDWARHYGCYLDRLRRLGLTAYASDPASCGQ
ncbi:MAG: hypothetical protein H6R17_1560 [Proteobacteria bacterium]|nr:hypothetical protein [Pseudomonadota bacterium]